MNLDEVMAEAVDRRDALREQMEESGFKIGTAELNPMEYYEAPAMRELTLHQEGLFFVQYDHRCFAVMAYNSDDAWRQVRESLRIAMYTAQVFLARRPT